MWVRGESKQDCNPCPHTDPGWPSGTWGGKLKLECKLKIEYWSYSDLLSDSKWKWNFLTFCHIHYKIKPAHLLHSPHISFKERNSLFWTSAISAEPSECYWTMPLKAPPGPSYTVVLVYRGLRSHVGSQWQSRQQLLNTPRPLTTNSYSTRQMVLGAPKPPITLDQADT